MNITHAAHYKQMNLFCATKQEAQVDNACGKKLFCTCAIRLVHRYINKWIYYRQNIVPTPPVLQSKIGASVLL